MARAISLVLIIGLSAPALAQVPAPAKDGYVSPPESASNVDQKANGEDPALVQASAPKPATQEPSAPEPSGFTIRRIDFGLSNVETDTNSSRFREYRAVPTGVFLPFVRFAGNRYFRYDVLGENVLQSDARYRVVAEPASVSIEAEFVKIPHRFGNQARSLLQDTGRGVLAVSDTLQQNFQSAIESQFARSRPGVNFAFLDNLVSPSLAAVGSLDLSLLRERGRVEVNLTRDKPVDVRLIYFHEKRRGNRASGTAFGFNNVVETPEPIDYHTQDFGATAEWARPWGLVRGAFHFNQFTNPIPVQVFDNPFRATDSTDASAYLGPSSSSVGGASFGRLSLPPDNKAATGSLGVLLKFAGKTRLTADASYGQWTQDAAFIPFATNTAITGPVRATDLSALPTRSLDGKINVLSLSSVLTSRPADRVNLTARFRRYDLDNKTPQIRFPQGYVRFDAVFEDIPRISVPYGYTTDRLDLSASYDFDPVNVEGGYKYEKWDRTFRETQETTQNTGYLAANLRASDWVVLRASFEKGSRDFDEYDPERSEHASFLEPGPPANLTLLRRFDQAAKDIDRFAGLVQLSPGGNATITLSYLKGKDDYTERSTHGLLKADNESISAEVDYTPHERLNLFGFYTRENISTFQRGRQSGATLSTNPLDDWTSEIQDRVDSFGGGATVGLVKEKLDLKLYGNYQRLDGNNDIFSPVGGAPEVARRALGGVAGIALFDDTKRFTLSADLAYQVTKVLTVTVGGWYEDYTLRDSNTSDSTGGISLANYAPGSFFLAAIDSDYKAHVLYARASYVW